MVAIVSGNSLGLSLTSLATLGQRGVHGDAATAGGSNEMAYVNAATGNLVLQTRDELLMGRGLSVDSTRTYNSQGKLNDDNGDNWSLGFYRQQLRLVGAPNTEGSTFIRTDRDGAQATFTYQAGVYVSKEGAGAFDRIKIDSATSWTFTDGATGVMDTYDAATGRLIKTTIPKVGTPIDATAGTLTYDYYASGLLEKVTTTDGEVTRYVYQGDSNKLIEVTTQTKSDGVLVPSTRVRYEYDALDRLQHVKVDLKDSAKQYVTTYGYEGDSKRVASISQNEGGNLIQFKHEEIGGEWRVTEITDGLGRLTKFKHEPQNRRTIVTDPGQGQTIYEYDAAGQLKVVAWESGGQTIQRYEYFYNADGDVEAVVDGSGNQVRFKYANGNQIEQEDSAGNVVTRTFNAVTNQLERETVYTGPNRTSPLTTLYFYDGYRLRFEVSPQRRVTEHRYDAKGQRVSTIGYPQDADRYTSVVLILSALEKWAKADNRPIRTTRVDYKYDVRGQLAQTIAYNRVSSLGVGWVDASESYTDYVYKPDGTLHQIILPERETPALPKRQTTQFFYDELGRVIKTIDATNGTTVTTYDDRNNSVTVELKANGLKTTSVHDRAGRLVSVHQTDGLSQVLGKTTYAYDPSGRLVMSTDPTGIRQWTLHDEAGRKIAEVDGNGSLVEHRYDQAGRLTVSIAYAEAIDTQLLVDGAGNPKIPEAHVLAAAIQSTQGSDRWTRYVYDKAGRLAKTVAPDGAVTETIYDGASRVVKVKSYAARISGTHLLPDVLAPEDIAPTPDSINDRSTRRLYDGDGLLVGELDGEGGLVEYTYDQAGRRTSTVRYVVQVGSANRELTTLAALKQSLGAGTATVSSFVFYNLKGQVIGEVDGERYLTEFSYDLNGNLLTRTRYNPPLTSVVTTASNVNTLRTTWDGTAAAPGVVKEKQVTQWTYDKLQRVETLTEPDGTVTRYTYDAAGNLQSTTRAVAQGLDERTINRRYDVQGRLTAELSGEDAWRLTAGLSAADRDAVFEQYGIKHTYDKAGRRTSTTDRNGLSTLFFYNEDSQLTFTVNGMGEVEERRYNGLGQLEATLRYGTRVAAGTMGNLKTGLTTIAAEVAKIANAAKDDKTSYAYELSGLVDSATVSLKGGRSSVTRFDYNAFGQETDRWTDLDDGSGRVRHDESAYDRRGLVRRNTVDTAGLRIDTQFQYDAFGRRTYVYDHNTGKFTQTDYDKLGRTVMVTDRLGQTRRTTYDAFDRVVKQYDGLDQVTEFTHNTAARSVEMKTPEGITVTTVQNRHGQVQSVTDGERNTTSHVYDRDGNLTDTIAPIASASTSQKFERGRLVETTDGNGVRVQYRHDDANRVIERETIGLDGQRRLTKYEYDASGRQYKVTSPEGIVTLTEYELGGRVMTQTVDYGTGPKNLNLVTQYVHDAAGNVLTVTSPGGKVTRYQYDALGRRTEEVVDPDGLKLKTTYTYDHQGNVRSRTEPTGAVTRYVYDAEGRLLLTVDGVGAITRHEYDKNDRVTRTTRYAKEISLVGLPLEVSVTDIEPKIVRNPGRDAIDARRYDRDGRLRFTGDGTGAVVEYKYDGNGNVKERIAYAKAINIDAWTTGDPPVVSTGSDQRLRNEYDALNRLTYQADATGAVTLREYDDNGNVTRITAFATALLAGKQPYEVTKRGDLDRVSTMAYDAANRETWRIDAEGAVSHRAYDGDGRLEAFTRCFVRGVPGSDAALLPRSMLDDARNRVTRTSYDGAGRRAHEVDAMNFVTRWTYDDANNSETTIRFSTALTAGQKPEDLRVELDPKHQKDVYVRDKAGRLVQHVDAEGGVETYRYDALKNTKTYTNQIGAAWTYTYDAVGRLTSEASPMVQVTRTREVGGVLVDDGTSARSIRTRLTYDALGNLLFRTEADDAEGTRVTQYEYDARGRQIRVVYPNVKLYGALAERALETRTFYDALGNAVANIDVAGNTSYKAYDIAGRLKYEVDAMGQVTGYVRNAFGEAEETTRYAAAVTVPPHITAEVAAKLPSGEAAAFIDDSLLPNALDRELLTTYDQLGRVARVDEPEVYNFDALSGVGAVDHKVTIHSYDAFGAVVKTRVSGAAAGSLAAETFYYHDKLGRLTEEVDALGHLTLNEYDFAGNLATRTEFAEPSKGSWSIDSKPVIERSASDRVTAWSYDELNRKVRETKVGAQVVANADAIAADGSAQRQADVVTTYGYDEVGNLTRTTVNDGTPNSSTVLSYYDAMGRVTAVGSPPTQGVVGNITPLTLFKRDAYGNVVVKRELATGAIGLREQWDAQRENERKGLSQPQGRVSSLLEPGYTPVLDELNDRITVTQFDAMGREARVTDAEGKDRYVEYVANGQQAVTRREVTDVDGDRSWLYQRFEYDKLGRLQQTIDPAPNAQAGETVTRLEYNAFGEVTKRLVNGKEIEYYKYDNAGRMDATNSGNGVDRFIAHDVLGRATAELSWSGAVVSTISVAEMGLTVQSAMGNASFSRTLTQYDALGRVEARVMPERTEEAAKPGVKLVPLALSHTSKAQSFLPASSETNANFVSLQWGASLADLGSGDIKVEVQYLAGVYDTETKKQGYEREDSYTQIFPSEKATTGVEVAWRVDNKERVRLNTLYSVVVSKMDANGVFRELFTYTPEESGKKIYGVQVARAADPAVMTVFETSTDGEHYTPADGAIEFGPSLWYDLADLGTSLSYRVKYVHLNAPTGTPPEIGATGRIDTIGVALGEIPVAVDYGVGGAPAGAIAWQAPPAGYDQVFNYRSVDSSGEWTPAEINAPVDGYNRVDTTGLPAGEYQYELLWTGAGKPPLHATGRFTVTAEVPPNVTGIQVTEAEASWDSTIAGMPIAGGAVFEWQLASEGENAWNAITEITTTNGKSTVSLADLVPESYRFRIRYMQGDDVQAQGTIDATMKGPVGPQLSFTEAPRASDFKMFGTQLAWDHPSLAARTFEYRQLDANGNAISGWLRDLPVTAAPTSANSAAVDLASVLRGYNYEFRIMSEEAGGATITVGAGNFSMPAVQPAYTPPPTISNFNVVAVQGWAATTDSLTWTTPPAGGTPLLEYKRRGSSEAWKVATVDTTQSRAAMSQFPPDEYDIRISYSVGGMLQAFGAGHLSVPAVSTAPLNLSFADTTASKSISTFYSNGTQLYWTRPAGVDPANSWFEYRSTSGLTSWLPVRPVPSGSLDTFTFPADLNGSYDFRITYFENGSTTAALGRGVFAASTVSASSPDLTQGNATVQNVSVSSSWQRVQWSTWPHKGTPSFMYRPKGSMNSADWKLLPIRPLSAGTEHVDFATVPRGTYEFKITYKDDPGTVLALGRGEFSNAQPGLVVDGRNTLPANWVTINGSTLSWNKITDNVRVEFHTLGTDKWVPAIVTPLGGGQHSVNTVGSYNATADVRISYTDGPSGALVAFHTFRLQVSSTGTLSIESAKPNVPENTIILVPGQSLSWQALGSWDKLQVEAKPVAGGGWTDLKTINRVSASEDGARHQIDLKDLASDYDVRIRYVDDTGTVFGLELWRLTGLGTSSPQLTDVYQGAGGGEVLGLSAGPGGFSWTSAPTGTPTLMLRRLNQAGATWFTAPAGFSGNSYIKPGTLAEGDYEYRLIFRDSGNKDIGLSSGVWHTNWQVPSGSPQTTGFTNFTVEPNSLKWLVSWSQASTWGTPRLEYRAANTSGTWQKITDVTTAGDVNTVSLKPITASGDYDVRVVYEKNGEIMALASGHVTRTITPGAAPTVASDLKHNVISVTTSGITISNPLPPGTTTALYLRTGGGSYVKADFSRLDANNRHVFELPSNVQWSTSYEYLLLSVLYPNGQSQAIATGSFTMPAAPVTPMPKASYAHVQPILGFELYPAGAPTQIRWPDSYSQYGTPQFELRKHGEVAWTTSTPTTSGGWTYMLLPGLSAADQLYEFRVTYRLNGEIRAASGGNLQTFATQGAYAPPPKLTSTAVQAVSGVELGSDTLTWLKPASGTPSLEFRTLNGTEWLPLQVIQGIAANRDGVSTAGGSEAYEFRITYRDAAGNVLAFTAGTVTFPVGDAPPDYSITTPPYKAPSYSGLNTTALHPHAISVTGVGSTVALQVSSEAAAFKMKPQLVQKVDRWGNVLEVSDPRNGDWKTKYTWDFENRLVKQEQPLVHAWQDGQNVQASPTTRIYYDALGNQVGVVDARGNINRRYYDASGELVQERHADGGVVTHRFNAFGDEVQTVDAVGNAPRHVENDPRFSETEAQAVARKLEHTKDMVYDKLGRLLETRHGPVSVFGTVLDTNTFQLHVVAPPPGQKERLSDRYEYDEAGRRIKVTNGAGEMTQYKYDAAGHVVESRQVVADQAAGIQRYRVASYEYDEYGHKSSETDGNDVTQRWVNDAFGRVQAHTDLGGVQVTYTYDKASRVLTKVERAERTLSDGTKVAASSQAYAYDEVGQLLEIADSLVEGTRTSTYRYDAAGNRVHERTQQGSLLLQDNYLAYDELGRLRDVWDGRMHVGLQYDLNGNRTAIEQQLVVQGLNGVGAGMSPGATGFVQPTAQPLRREFGYDAMNRQTRVDEFDERLGIVRHDLEYDGNGNRIKDKFRGNKVITEGGQQVYLGKDENGTAVYTQEDVTYTTVLGDVEEEYSYDGMNRLTSTLRDRTTQVDLRRYDRAGRVVASGAPDNLPNKFTAALNKNVALDEQVALHKYEYNYDARGRLRFQQVYNSEGIRNYAIDYVTQAPTPAPSSSPNEEPAQPPAQPVEMPVGYDAAGNVVGYYLHEGDEQFGQYHRFKTERFDRYVQREQHAQGTGAAVTTSAYDANGHLVGVIDSGQPDNNRTLYNDAQGRVLLVKQGDNLLRQLVVNGEVLGSYGVGPDEVRPKSSSGVPQMSRRVDFEWGFQGISAQTPGPGPGAYTVQQGDTLQNIARAAYGDSRLWYRIAEANGLGSDADLKVGQTLSVPTSVGGLHNASDTFEPYDPSKVIGDTSPTLPMPEKGGCGALGQIIMIVVAIVVTVWTAGAASAASWSTLAAGAAGGAAGAVASQVVGNAIGVVDGFSWKAVALGALGGLVTAGIGEFAQGTWLGGSGWEATAARAALGSAVSQGIGVATGLQDKFSWRNVAASAVGAGIGAAVTENVNFGTDKIGQLLAKATGDVVGGTARALISSRGHIRGSQLAADVFGNALGNGIVDSMTTQGTGPWSDKNYTNEYDKQSDRAYEARRSQEWITQSDEIQLRRMGEAAAPHREQQWIDQSDAIQRQRMATASADVAQENFRALERQYRQATDTGAKSRVSSVRPGSTGFAFSDNRDAKDIRLSFSYQSQVSRILADRAAVMPVVGRGSPGQFVSSGGSFDPLSPAERFVARNEGLYSSPIGGGVYGAARSVGVPDQTARGLGAIGSSFEVVAGAITAGGALKDILGGPSSVQPRDFFPRNGTSVPLTSLEVFTGSSGPQLPGARGVGPSDPTAIALDARSMPNIPSNSMARVVGSNPYIPPAAGGTFQMMDYLPELARVTQAGGTVVINGNMANKYYTTVPSAAQLSAMGLELRYEGRLLPEFSAVQFRRTDGSPIDPNTMRSTVFVKKN